MPRISLVPGFDFDFLGVVPSDTEETAFGHYWTGLSSQRSETFRLASTKEMACHRVNVGFAEKNLLIQGDIKNSAKLFLNSGSWMISHCIRQQPVPFD